MNIVERMVIAVAMVMERKRERESKAVRGVKESDDARRLLIEAGVDGLMTMAGYIPATDDRPIAELWNDVMEAELVAHLWEASLLVSRLKFDIDTSLRSRVAILWDVEVWFERLVHIANSIRMGGRRDYQRVERIKKLYPDKDTQDWLIYLCNHPNPNSLLHERGE